MQQFLEQIEFRRLKFRLFQLFNVKGKVFLISCFFTQLVRIVNNSVGMYFIFFIQGSDLEFYYGEVSRIPVQSIKYVILVQYIFRRIRSVIRHPFINTFWPTFLIAILDARFLYMIVLPFGILVNINLCLLWILVSS